MQELSAGGVVACAGTAEWDCYKHSYVINYSYVADYT